MLIENHINQFLEELEFFDYTISNFSRNWEVPFKNQHQEWGYLHISKHEKTFYISDFIGDNGSLEVVAKQKVKIVEAGVFSEAHAFDTDDTSNEDWLNIIKAATKWLKFVKKDWIKANRQIQENFPLKFRYGTVSNSLIMALFPKKYRLDKDIGKRRTRKFIRLVESGYFLPNEKHIIESMTAAKYFDYCKLAYLATITKKDKIDKTLSGREMYKRFADGRHEGLLDIAPQSEQEFADWIDGKHPKRTRGGHPWEIKRGGSYTHIGLRVSRPYYRTEGFTIELYGDSLLRLAETLKMFLAIYNAALPITIPNPDSIRKRLLGQDNTGIIPNYDSLTQADQHFHPEEDVFEVIYYDDLKKYEKRIIPFIQWKTLPMLKPKVFDL